MSVAPAPLAVAALLCVAVAGAAAQSLPPYRRTPPVAPPAPPASAAQPDVNLTADDVLSHIGGVAQARGHVELQRLDIDLFTDYLQYDQLSDTAHAEGDTRVNRGLDWFTADRLDLEIQKSAGTLLRATYGLGKTGAGGTASRIELIDADRAVAYDATFTGCPRNGDEHPDEHPDDHPDWVLTGTRIDIDTATNEGRATGAVLHFLGVPILAAPSLTFPVTAERKSGWLPPLADFSNSSGLTFGVPYYWNYSPNVDATLTPSIITRRGASMMGELRYLGSSDIGQVTATALPDDRLAGYGRGSFQWAHEGERAGGLFDYSVRWQQVSDDQYWKDFPHQVPSLTQRLLPIDLSGVQRIPLGDSGEFETYARVQRWQTLQDFEDPSAVIQAPYQRSPQIGLRGGYTLANQLHVDLETEINRFDLEDRAPGDNRFGGERAHIVAAVSR
ncbi:MAG TPA: LPS assembly protein LptD, partial [Burkholderiaceae bacterium]|nr:LPS assembly protein LptD [Burkholderiaceae bacterium]